MRYFSKLSQEEKANIFNSIFKERDGKLIYKQDIISLIREKYDAYIPKGDVFLFNDLEKNKLLLRTPSRGKSILYKVNYRPITVNSEIIVNRRRFKTNIYPKKIKYKDKVISINFAKEIEINGEKYKIYRFVKNPFITYNPIQVCAICKSLHNGICILKRSICNKYLQDHEIPIKQEDYYYEDIISMSTIETNI